MYWMILPSSFLQLDPTEGNVSMNNTIVPGALNGTAKLTAHIKSLKGNPTPNITWVDPNGSEIAFPNDRFSSDVDNVLNIDSIQSSDYGKYLYIADNGIGEKLTLEITLDQACMLALHEYMYI